MLSNASQYAIRAMLYLAMYSDENQKIGVKNIADALETPQPFLAKLLQRLSRDEIVSSQKGPAGGFYLNDKNLKKPVWEVINCIDGTEKFDQCFLGLSKCSDENPCPVHFTVVPFRNKILKDFKDKTIEKFVEEIIEKGRHISLKNLEI